MLYFKIGIFLRLLVAWWLFTLISGPSALADPFKAANAPGAVGETTSLFLLDQGLFGRPLYNDIFGRTDKQLTGGAQLGYLTEWSDSSLELRTHWLFLTPTFHESLTSSELKTPVGRYADWVEIQSAWAKVIDLNGLPARVQLSLGLSDVGNHGAKNIHRKIHQQTGSSLLGLDYDNQPTGRDISYGIEFGLIDRDLKLLNLTFQTLFNLGYSQNEFMQDLYLNYHLVSILNENWRLGFEARLPAQIGSKVYADGIRQNRQEFAVSVRYKWYRPSIKYLSPFLKGDNVAQVYLDPLAFCIDF